jgi:hypothetical protein
MRHVPWKELGWTTGVVAIVLLTYVGTYAVLVRPASVPETRGADELSLTDWAEFDTAHDLVGFRADDNGPSIRIRAEYRFAEDFCIQAFGPIHHLDAMLRNEMWHHVVRRNLIRG